MRNEIGFGKRVIIFIFLIELQFQGFVRDIRFNKGGVIGGVTSHTLFLAVFVV